MIASRVYKLQNTHKCFAIDNGDYWGGAELLKTVCWLRTAAD